VNAFKKSLIVAASFASLSLFNSAIADMVYKPLEQPVEPVKPDLKIESVNEKLNDPNLRYFEDTFDIVYVKHNDNWEMQESPQFNKAMFFNLQFNSLTQN